MEVMCVVSITNLFEEKFTMPFVKVIGRQKGITFDACFHDAFIYGVCERTRLVDQTGAANDEIG